MYGPLQIPNEVTLALMAPLVHLGSKTSQEADDNQTAKAAIKHDPRIPYLLYVIHAYNN